MEELYRVLGLRMGASDEEVKYSYRKLVMLYHPDRNQNPGAYDKFLAIQKAYEILTDPNRKASYQQSSFGNSETNTTQKSSREYKRSSYKKKTTEDFDPKTHCPNYLHSYVTTDDADYFCLLKIATVAVLFGVASTIGMYYVLQIFVPVSFVPTFWVGSFMLFDLLLLLDLRLVKRKFHAFIVKVTEDKDKGLYSLYMSMGSNPIVSYTSVEEIHDADRYRNYFYAKQLHFDYRIFPNFAVTRTFLFSICLGFIAYRERDYLELPYFAHRAQQITQRVYLHLVVGLILLVFQNVSWVYPLCFVYFLYHFYFIRQVITNNRLE